MDKKSKTTNENINRTDKSELINLKQNNVIELKQIEFAINKLNVYEVGYILEIIEKKLRTIASN